MTLALISTIISSTCMALMIVTDRVLVADYYQNRPTQAWLVSSILGSAFGLALTLAVCVAYTTLSGSDVNLFSLAIELFWWRGLAIFAVGIVAIQILLHYFRCFAEDTHAASIAAWLAAAPIFILVAVIALSFIAQEPLPTLIQSEGLWFLGAIVATAGLVWFERLTGGRDEGVGGYRRELALMLFWSVVYSIGLRFVLAPSESTGTLEEALALLPFYWLGFAAGARVLLKKDERVFFKSNWKRRMRHYIGVILFVEVIGMFVFFFEFFGLSGLDPVYVNIIVGAHVFVVYGLTLLLSSLRSKLTANDKRTVRLFGVRLLRENLPEAQSNPHMIVLELSALGLVTAGVFLTSLYSLF